MKQLYICNQANNPLCPNCHEGQPHEKNSNIRISGNEQCTEWSECYGKDGMFLFKVRCIKYKEK